MLSPNKIQYVTDANGTQTSVILQFQEWEKINREYELMTEKLKHLYAVESVLEKLERNQTSVLSKQDIVKRAKLSEENIRKNEYCTIEELETDTLTW